MFYFVFVLHVPILNLTFISTMNRTPITCDLSSCHQHVPGIFHGRTDPITNDEVLELMASQNSQHLSSSVQGGFLATSAS